MRRIFYFAVFISLLFSYVPSARAQAAKAELVGEVRDQNGSLVSQAKITLTEVAIGQTSSSTTNDGNFTVTNLRPGLYNIRVGATGFKQSLREGVRLATGERVRLDFVLEPGAVTEVVTIN